MTIPPFPEHFQQITVFRQGRPRLPGLLFRPGNVSVLALSSIKEPETERNEVPGQLAEHLVNFLGRLVFGEHLEQSTAVNPPRRFNRFDSETRKQSRRRHPSFRRFFRRYQQGSLSLEPFSAIPMS